MDKNEKISNLNQLEEKIYELESIFINVQIELEKFINTLSPDAICFCQSQKSSIDLQRDYEADRYECSKEEMKERIEFFLMVNTFICQSYLEKIRPYYGDNLTPLLNRYLGIRRNYDILRKEIWKLKEEKNELMLELGMSLSSVDSLEYRNLKRQIGYLDRKMMDSDFRSFLQEYDLNATFDFFCSILGGLYYDGIWSDWIETEWCKTQFYMENTFKKGTWKEFLINAKASVASKRMKKLKIEELKKGIK